MVLARRLRRPEDVSAAAWACGRLRAPREALRMLLRRGELGAAATVSTVLWAAAEAQVTERSRSQLLLYVVACTE